MKLFNLFIACSLLSAGACFVSCGSDSHSKTFVEESQVRTITFDQFTVTNGVIGETKAESAPATNYLKVVDVCGGQICNEIDRNKETDADVLATLSLEMSYGHHDLYFVCAQNPWDSFSANDLTLTWDSKTAHLSDAWGVHVGLDVNASTPASQSVSMDRLVAYLQMVIEDAIPVGISSFDCTLAGGSWTLNLTNMSGSMAGVVDRKVDLPESKIGATGVTVGLAVFVPEGTTKATSYQFSALDKDGAVVASRIFSNVPIEANHYTTFTGNFFSGESGFQFSVKDSWGTPNVIKY